MRKLKLILKILQAQYYIVITGESINITEWEMSANMGAENTKKAFKVMEDAINTQEQMNNIVDAANDILNCKK